MFKGIKKRGQFHQGRVSKAENTGNSLNIILRHSYFLNIYFGGPFLASIMGLRGKDLHYTDFVSWRVDLSFH